MFIVGGVGITPTRSILRTLRDTGDRRLAWLVYGAGSSATVLRRSELEALARDQVLDLTLATQEPPPGWEGERGLINREMLARSLPDPATAGLQYFICGPGPMLDAVAEALQRLRVPGRAIRAERFNIARGVGRGGTRPFSLPSSCRAILGRA